MDGVYHRYKVSQIEVTSSLYPKILERSFNTDYGGNTDKNITGIKHHG